MEPASNPDPKTLSYTMTIVWPYKLGLIIVGRNQNDTKFYTKQCFAGVVKMGKKKNCPCMQKISPQLQAEVLSCSGG